MARPLRVLVTGATGLIGSALVDALIRRGHDPLPAVRDPAEATRRWPGRTAVAVDFGVDHDVDAWLPRLAGCDAVVNAAGLFREHAGNSFQAVHVAAPKALFEACLRARVRRVVQLSALGADARAETSFHRSKHEADRALQALPLSATVVRPSLVYSPQGASTQMFLAWASLPWTPVPGRGDQRIQPVHLDDLCEVLVNLLEAETVPDVLNAVGPAPLDLRGYLAGLRTQLGLSQARTIRVPLGLLHAGARLLQRGRRTGHASEALRMLERGNTADAAEMNEWLGNCARSPAAFVPPPTAPALLAAARLRWLLPLLRLSIALVWIGSGLVSLGLYPISESLALLSRVGLEGAMARAALFSAAAIDLVFGVMLLWRSSRRWLQAQALVVVAYTAILTVALPEFWLHPFAPLLKNLPILIGLWILYEFQGKPRWT